jgi:hypothetical protein
MSLHVAPKGHREGGHLGALDAPSPKHEKMKRIATIANRRDAAGQVCLAGESDLPRQTRPICTKPGLFADNLLRSSRREEADLAQPFLDAQFPGSRSEGYGRLRKVTEGVFHSGRFMVTSRRPSVTSGRPLVTIGNHQ